MTKPADSGQIAKARERIEGMYQRAMDLRDSTPCPDWQAANKVEKKYLGAYMKAFKKTHDVEAFKLATRKYRRFLRDSSRVP